MGLMFLTPSLPTCGRWLLPMAACLGVLMPVAARGADSLSPPDAARAEQPASDLEALRARLARGAMWRFKFAARPAPERDTDLRARDGGITRLSALRGRTVLVNVWASWCPPCREEMPSLVRLASRLASEGLVVVALGIDKQPAAAERFLGEMPLGALAVYADPEAQAAGALGARGVPVSILLDAQGREIGRLEGAADWASDEAVLLVRAAITGRLSGAADPAQPAR